MIPTRTQCLLLFDRFNLPSQKRIHVEEVTRLALFMADKLVAQGIEVNRPLLEASALLHDIDKNIPKKEGERHPETGVRVLRELGYTEVAAVVARHSLYHILNPKTAPQSWEEKLLYLADKMTKYEVIGIKHRFALWFKEGLPPEAEIGLTASLPLVEALEQEVYDAGKFSLNDISEFAKTH